MCAVLLSFSIKTLAFVSGADSTVNVTVKTCFFQKSNVLLECSYFY